MLLDGSSPLSRGIPLESLFRVFAFRIIPALAGNTDGKTPSPPLSGDHPRSRGEYWIAPPMCTTDTWIIPALAGNTPWKPTSPVGTRDHPRSRGEYVDAPHVVCGLQGSSPLSRGIPSRPYRPESSRRIIPALAGNTLVDKGFYQPDLSDLGNPLLARLRFSKSLAPRRRRPPSWRGGSSGSASEGPGRTIRVSPS